MARTGLSFAYVLEDDKLKCLTCSGTIGFASRILLWINFGNVDRSVWEFECLV